MTTLADAVAAIQEAVAGPLESQAQADPPAAVRFTTGAHKVRIQWSGSFAASGVTPWLQVVVDDYTYLCQGPGGLEFKRVGTGGWNSRLPFDSPERLRALLETVRQKVQTL